MSEEAQAPVLIVDGEKLSGLIAKMLGSEYSTNVAHDGLGAVQKLREQQARGPAADAE